MVVAYQPGEYQPNAVDDLAGNNFQILANAIYFAAYRVGTPALSRQQGMLALVFGVVLHAGMLRLQKRPNRAT